jgi:acyl-CoA reductase-like NAD-dependent aldehyde dehydrogenase
MSEDLTVNDIPRAVQELRQTFNAGHTRPAAWRKQQLKACMRLVTEGRKEIENALFQDLGKNATEAFTTEINMVAHEVQFMLDHIDELMAPSSVPTDAMNFPGKSFQYKDPLGVALVIGAWNYPFMLTFHPVVGALAAGNAVLIKVPSQHYSKASSLAIKKLVNKYLDNSAVKVACGDRDMTQAVIQERYDIIFYTGGSYVGQMVAEAAAKHLTPTILELGGKSPCIIDKSADLKIAARRVAWGAVGLNNGQTCIRPDYVLVHEDVAEDFLKNVERSVKQFFGTDASKSRSYSRIVNSRAATGHSEIIEADRKYLRFGGKYNVEEKYVEPTCLDFKNDLAAFQASKAMEDEIFGPIIPVYRYHSLDEVLGLITSREKPLALYVFTTDIALCDRVLTETSSGGAVVNDVVMHIGNNNLPFGGVGKSGMGSYHGKKSFESFSHTKSVLMKSNRLDAPQRYPPYKPMGSMEMAIKPIPEWKTNAVKQAFRVATLLALFGGASSSKGQSLLAHLRSGLKAKL